MNILKTKTVNHQKFRTFVFLSVIALFTVGIGVAQVNRLIKKPQKDLFADDPNGDVLSGFQYEQVREFDPSLQDTDQDGLTDYDEINMYGTSPYLPDTDSDGYSDAEEINSGNDPNCPIGADCRTQRIDEENSSSVQPFEELAAPVPEELYGQQGVDILNLNNNDLRVILLESGQLTKDQLDSITDEQLQAIYQETINTTSVQ